VLTLDATDLLDTTALPLAGAPSRLLDIGFRDGPLPPPDVVSRVARWTRTVWPLFRFHEFARAAIADRLVPEAGTPFPEHFADLHAVLGYRYGPRAALAEDAYSAWRANPSLERFVAYLQQASPEHLELVRARTRQAAEPGADTRGVRTLRALLDRLASHGRALIVLVPENPILEQDRAGELHRPALSDHVASIVKAEAAARGIQLVDLRRALGMEAFLDFDHPIPELGGFEKPLAEEIARARHT
jgi:hypothetical protein